MKALGLRELMAHVQGDCDLDQAIGRAQGATRHYAKRQVTWFSRQFIADYTVREKFSESDIHNIIPNVISFFLTPTV